jgi:hypothetical protein
MQNEMPKKQTDGGVLVEPPFFLLLGNPKNN